MTSHRIPKAKHGRWYARYTEDPVDGLPDEMPAQQAAVSAAQLIDETLPSPSYHDLTFWDHLSVTDSETVALNP